MQVNAPHAPIGEFFNHRPIYLIPKYQRGYAWDKEELTDFVNDLEICYNTRKSGGEMNHFFGSIVCVKKSVPEIVNQDKFELVDGQQRLATFVLLVSTLLKIYRELKIEAISSSDSANELVIGNRIETWTSRFIEFKLEVSRIERTIQVLSLSQADSAFFNQVIRGSTPTPSRHSHNNILNAFNTIYTKLVYLIDDTSLNNKLDNLEIIHNCIDKDFTILRIETDTQDNAYRLFQVLNNRGRNLTEGDLLRARLLEILEGFPTEQASVENCWDEILADTPNKTSDYLRWIYASHKGQRAGKSSLFDDFLNQFFSGHQPGSIVQASALSIVSNMEEIKNQVLLCRKLLSGEWPFSIQAPIEEWHRSRLDLLINGLGHTLSMPLLLSAHKLGHREFFELTNTIERFAFRYITISGQHPTPVVKIYHEESVAINSNPSSYNLNTLKSKLRVLQNVSAPLTVFESNLDTLTYKVRGGNKPIKYFLITIESYLQWYRNGQSGNPKNTDPSFAYNFTGATIEHIYPRRAQGTVIESTLEPYKNTLGNLTLMGPTPNGFGGNDNFSTKQPIFLASSVLMNREIGTHIQWTTTELNTRLAELKAIANTIFTI